MAAAWHLLHLMSPPAWQHTLTHTQAGNAHTHTRAAALKSWATSAVQQQLANKCRMQCALSRALCLSCRPLSLSPVSHSLSLSLSLYLRSCRCIFVVNLNFATAHLGNIVNTATATSKHSSSSGSNSRAWPIRDSPKTLTTHTHTQTHALTLSLSSSFSRSLSVFGSAASVLPLALRYLNENFGFQNSVGIRPSVVAHASLAANEK